MSNSVSFSHNLFLLLTVRQLSSIDYVLNDKESQGNNKVVSICLAGSLFDFFLTGRKVSRVSKCDILTNRGRK